MINQLVHRYIRKYNFWKISIHHYMLIGIYFERESFKSCKYSKHNPMNTTRFFLIVIILCNLEVDKIMRFISAVLSEVFQNKN